MAIGTSNVNKLAPSTPDSEVDEFSPQAYRPEIDGLRALAVLSVIINHFNKDLLPSGYLGVDIFFVISGFVITSSLYNRRQKNLREFLCSFYARRIKRLVPAHVVCAVITSILICLFNPAPMASLKTGIASLFGISNLYLLRQEADYFGDAIQLNAFTHTWSLGVEEQFYFFFPFIVWFTRFGRRLSMNRMYLPAVLAVLAITSLLGFIQLRGTNQSAVYFLMPTRVWELGVGALAFIVMTNSGAGRLSSLLRLVPLPVSLAIGVVLFMPLQLWVYATTAAVILTALLIVSVHPQCAVYTTFTHPTIVNLGRISYSLYLWHWSILSISRWTIGIHWWSVPLQAGLIVIAAIWSYRYVEKPLRSAEWSSVQWKTLLYGIATLIGTAGLLACLLTPLGKHLFLGTQLKMIAIGPQSLTETYSLTAGSSAWSGEPCVLANNSQVGKKISIEECTLGDFSSSTRRILVVGNSFSATMVQAFDQLVLSDNYAVTITSAWGASPVPEIPNTGRTWDKVNDYYWEKVIPSLASRLREDDWVFLVNDLESLSPEQSSRSSEQVLRQLERGLEVFSDQLSRSKVRLAVLHGLPFAREAQCEPTQAQEQWFAPFGSPCFFLSKEQTVARRAKLDGILSALRRQGKITLVDLMDLFCPGTTCTYHAMNGQMLYRDVFSHPSVEAVRLAAPIIRESFR